MSEPPSQPLLDFAVPDDLLREAIKGSHTEQVVADVQVMPGHGEGKPAPIRSILRSHGVGPIAWMTAAALVTLIIDNGLSILGPDIQRSFHVNDAALGAVVGAAAASQVLVGLPIAIWSDRGSRVRISALTLLLFALVVPLMGLAPSIAVFAVLAMVSAIGHGPRDTTHMSYLADAYPIEGRARILALHSAADPVARTLGIAAVGYVAAITGSWRWGLALALLGVPVALGILRQREPAKGANENAHILRVSGLADAPDGDAGTKVLFGPALTRLLRIRSFYYQLVAVAVLGFAGLGIPLFGNLYLERHWHLDSAGRANVYVILGTSAFLAIPIAGPLGDRLFRKRPESLLQLGAIALCGFGVLYGASVYLPSLWMVVVGWFLAECCTIPLGTAISQTVAATAPPEMRSIAFGMFGVYGLVFGGFLGNIVLGAISDTTSAQFALSLMAPVCIVGAAILYYGSRFVRGDITRVVEDTLEKFAEAQRRSSGGAIPALQVAGLDFSYGAQQVLYDVSLQVEEGEIAALLGTNGAGKSTLLRCIAGLEYPSRGAIRIFGRTTGYLAAEQVVDLGVGLLAGGKMTFPGLSVTENLRIAAHPLRKDSARARQAVDEVFELFPRLHERRDARAGTLSGGEQQQLALGRVLMTKPRLMLIDELTLGLAPKVVEDLIAVVRRVNERGTTVLLVEQSANLAMALADHAFFLERGEVRFDGATAELLQRDDLLRPVFLAPAVPA